LEVRFCRCFIFGRIINVLLMAARIHYVSIWLRSRIRYYKCIERVSVLGEQTPFFVELINLRRVYKTVFESKQEIFIQSLFISTSFYHISGKKATPIYRIICKYRVLADKNR